MHVYGQFKFTIRQLLKLRLHQEMYGYLISDIYIVLNGALKIARVEALSKAVFSKLNIC